MLDSSPPAIVVGRTLSSYFVGDIQKNQETITYTVYNQQADPETGVLLTTTLEPGVTFSSGSQLPDMKGQNLAWSLGTIQGYDRTSVALNVTLASAVPTQLDSGAQAFATLDAGAVSAATPAATLSPGSLSNPSLLASTPDANLTDTYVQEEAAQLDYAPNQIFNFLHTQIGYNSYVGSVRGARGTLWSGAGNALDVASLGVALMRASGIPAQYAQGTLSEPEAQQLILSMFPAQDETIGLIPAGTQLSDPANDPHLLAETVDHYWFQFDIGSGMEDADPLMPGATIGQPFTTSTGTFAEVADDLRATTEIQLVAEVTNTADSLFGLSGQQDTTVLDQTFPDVELVGAPISVGNLVSGSSISAVLSATTYTYTPYIRLNEESADVGADPIINGTPYQEVLTNFPFGSQILTGLFLNVTLLSPPGGETPTSQTFQETLLDRIGYAARQTGGGSTINVGQRAASGERRRRVDRRSVAVASARFGGRSDDRVEPERRQPVANRSLRRPAVRPDADAAGGHCARARLRGPPDVGLRRILLCVRGSVGAAIPGRFPRDEPVSRCAANCGHLRDEPVQHELLATPGPARDRPPERPGAVDRRAGTGGSRRAVRAVQPGARRQDHRELGGFPGQRHHLVVLSDVRGLALEAAQPRADRFHRPPPALGSEPLGRNQGANHSGRPRGPRNPGPRRDGRTAGPARHRLDRVRPRFRQYHDRLSGRKT